MQWNEKAQMSKERLSAPDAAIPGSTGVSRVGFSVALKQSFFSSSMCCGDRWKAQEKSMIAKTRSPARETRALPSLSLNQRCGLFIERSVIRFVGLQVKFVYHDLHQRRSRDGEKNSQQPKHGRGGEGKEQDIDRM
jgi:hypothetical protein